MANLLTETAGMARWIRIKIDTLIDCLPTNSEPCEAKIIVSQMD